MADRTRSAAPREPSAARLVLTLSLAGLFSGVAIAGVHEITAPRIAENKARALRRAVFQVVPGAATMRAVVREGDALRAAVASRGPHAATSEHTVYATFDSTGAFRGWAIPGEGPGFQDAIQLIYGFDPARSRIVGMQVLTSRETPGLGDKILKDADFLANFADLAVEPRIELVKHGKKTQPHQVDAITGATISSRAVVRILQSSMEEWKAILTAQPPPTEEEVP